MYRSMQESQGLMESGGEARKVKLTTSTLFQIVSDNPNDISSGYT